MDVSSEKSLNTIHGKRLKWILALTFEVVPFRKTA